MSGKKGHDNIGGAVVSTTNQLFYNGNAVIGKEDDFDYVNGKFKYELAIQSSIYEVKVDYKTVISQGELSKHSITKQSVTNIYFVYANAPTVSYRQNCVGINITDPDGYTFGESTQTNAALVISAASGRNRIYFIGDKTDGFVDLSSGEIVGLTLGQDMVNKISIDCGSWD